MPRPDFISSNDLERWDAIIDEDDVIPRALMQSPVIREVCYAGQWMLEQLENLECPFELIVRIQFEAGKMSFGNDPWTIHEQFLDGYKNGKLDISFDNNEVLN